VYTLLKENYVEDSEASFRFDYPVEFLRWALLVPGYVQDWHVGIRVTKTKKLYAFISGIPVRTSVVDKEVKMAEINYLCVHKKLRAKRLAPGILLHTYCSYFVKHFVLSFDQGNNTKSQFD
jgi:glycylpeptide N-tetradecanoyltransferase